MPLKHTHTHTHTYHHKTNTLVATTRIYKRNNLLTGGTGTILCRDVDSNKDNRCVLLLIIIDYCSINLIATLTARSNSKNDSYLL